MYNGKDIKKVTKDASRKLKKPNPYAKDIKYDVTGEGMWNPENWNQPITIPGNSMATHGYGFPLYVEPNNGPGRIVYPDTGNQYFPGATNFREYPQHKVFETEEDFNKDRLLQIRNKYWPTKNTRLFDTGFDVPNIKSGPGPVRMPSVTSDYQGVAMMYGGIPIAQDGGKQVNTLEGDLISKVLMNRNRDKDFVQRAYALGQNPNMFSVPDPDQFGSNMSHKMAWGEDETGQTYMYPTVMNPRNESIKVPNQYADYISSEGYKKATGMKKYGGWLDSYKEGGPLPDVEKAKAFLEAGSIYGHPLSQRQFDAFTRIVREAEEAGEIESEEDYEFSGEYRRGGQYRKLRKMPRGKTSKNIQSSINFLLTRNKMLYGSWGARLYDPNSKFQDGGWLDQYQNAGQLRAASSTGAIPVSTQAPVNPTNKTGLDWVAEKWRNRDQGPSDWDLLMPDTHGGYTSSGVTPFDLMLPVQAVSGAKGALPLLSKANSTKINKKLKDIGTTTKAIVKDAVNTTKATVKDAVNYVDNKVVTPIQFKKEIQEIKELAKKQPEVFNNPVTQAKLEELGIDPKLIQLEPEQFKKLSFDSGSGSAYYPWADHINIDMRQIKRLKKQGYNLSPESAYQHELGHKIQQKNYLSSSEYKEALNNLMKTRSGVINSKSVPTKLDHMLGDELNLSANLSSKNPTVLESWDYYANNPTERLAHLREMRQGMIEKGIIKDQFQPITKQNIKNYVESTPNDRIVSFIDKGDIKNYSKLRDAFKLLPAVIPVGLGAGALQEQEYGGWLDTYQDAGTVLTKLKQEKDLRDAAEAAANFKSSTPASSTQYNKFIPKLSEKEVQFASLPKAQKEIVKKNQAMMASKKPEAKLSQGRKLTKQEQDYSEKVAGRIANPFHDVGSTAGNIASYLTRFKGLSPEEIASVTNNPMETLKMSGELGAHALANEAIGAGLMKVGAKAAPYVKHIAEEAPYYLPKVKLKGKPSIEFPEYSDYVRIQGQGFNKAKAPYNPKLSPEQNTYTGRWVGDDPIKGIDYVSGIQIKDPSAKFDIIKGRMPKKRLEQFKGKNLPSEAKLMSYGPGEFGTWENAFNEGAITDIERMVMSQYEKNPEKFLQEGSLHNAIYKNSVRKIAANPKLFEPSEALLPDMKIKMINLLKKKTGLSKKDAEIFLRKMGETKGGYFKNIKKYSPFKEGGTTNWLDKYK